MSELIPNARSIYVNILEDAVDVAGARYERFESYDLLLIESPICSNAEEDRSPTSPHFSMHLHLHLHLAAFSKVLCFCDPTMILQLSDVAVSTSCLPCPLDKSCSV